MPASVIPNHGDRTAEEATAALHAVHAKHDQILRMLRTAHRESVEALRAVADADLHGRLRRLCPTAEEEMAELFEVMDEGESGMAAHGLMLLALLDGSGNMVRRLRTVHARLGGRD